MRKKDELSLEHTCTQHAHPEEMLFVLLGRDPVAPIAIRAWVTERVLRGKNVYSDTQIVEAMECAATMAREGRKWVDAPVKRPPGAVTRCPASVSEIDAALFNGDTFDDPAARAELASYVERWARELARAAMAAASATPCPCHPNSAAPCRLIEGVDGIPNGWYRPREKW